MKHFEKSLIMQNDVTGCMTSLVVLFSYQIEFIISTSGTIVKILSKKLYYNFN